MTTITAKPYFKTDENEQVTLYTLKNDAGMEVDIADFGGVILSIRVPDRAGKMDDVVLGWEDAGYRTRMGYLGALIGRCCNRVGKGKFTLNGKDYQVALNDNGKNHLHGGDTGFDRKVWATSVVKGAEGDTLRLKITSPDGEEHYSGTLQVEVTYLLTAQNELTIHYQAVSDADTVCSLTNHAYFNLAGHASGTILDQQLKIYADSFTEADSESIPTGRVLPVEGTPMDFRAFHKVGERIGMDYEPLKLGCGYDHNWVLNSGNKQMGICAELYDEKSGRYMTCYTDSPCVQFYSGNFLNGTKLGKGGYHYQKNDGLCLETQFAPDAINHPDWDSPILRAGEAYDYTTIYKFSTK